MANEVFSHLTTFFRRYYDDGDFLSLRRYKKDTYAIPYEGEEVKLHWANADQYYIKSSEYLRDYVFKLPGQKRVHFKLVDATDEKDNIKQEHGKERRFRLCENEPVRIEGDNLYIRFTYLPDNTKQTDLNKKTLDYIVGVHNKSNQLNSFDKMFELMPTAKNPHRTLLEKHLNNYTARFNFDFFIHKNLGGFLRRELDFYIKNEVLFIDDLDEKDERQVFRSIGKIKVLKRIAHKIITFLAQIEDFQKKLWLKKKFVVECGYCVTLDRVPEELYDEIAKNDAQREEWVRLFAINEVKKDLINPGYTKPLTVKFLKVNPYLVIDTKFFDDEFKEKLLASFDNIDETCDGIIINSENFQALNLLHNKYQETIKCVYIDPPYNTGTDGFPYKDNYQHASWLSMIFDRTISALRLVSDKGVFFSSIDDWEDSNLEILFHQIFGKGNFLERIIWKKRSTPPNDKIIAAQHEYILTYSKKLSHVELNLRKRAKEQVDRYKNPDNHPKGPWTPGDLMANVKGGRYVPSLYFPIVNPTTREEHYPSSNGNWRFSKDKIARLLADKEIYFGDDGKGRPKLKRFLCDVKSGITYTTLWDFVPLNTQGSKEMTDIFGQMTAFENPKPCGLIEEISRLGSNLDTLFLDYFAGSGTTANAIINLNREDNVKCKYILIEMGQHFDTVLKPRIQKVIYSKDWKDGKPVTREGISHMFKYMKLESYEDTLDNLIIKRDKKQQKALISSKAVKEEYMLGYMLDIETRESDSLLNIDRFEDPFNYTLEIRHDNELKATKIDLVETFNYLIGLYVEQTEIIRGFKVIRGKLRTGEKTLVIWRNTKNKTNKELDTFFLKQGYNTRNFEFDKIFVNGDNNLENLKCAEDKWKVSLIEEEFTKRMFDVKDV